MQPSRYSADELRAMIAGMKEDRAARSAASIALPASGEVRMMVVGAPTYFAHRPPPAHPRDLAQH